MCHWIESLALLDGKVQNLDYHQERVNRTLYDHKAQGSHIDLEQVLLAKELPVKGYFKIRVLYNLYQVSQLDVDAYVPKVLSSFQLVEASDLNYRYKYVDRTSLNKLKMSVKADEVIILHQGLVTDTSFSNLIFERDGEWFTPSSFLLKGTQRTALLDQGKIKETKLSVDNLVSFSRFKLINAMLSLENSPTYFVNQIIGL